MKKVLFDLKGTQPSKTSKIHGGGRYGEMVLHRIIDMGLPVCCCYDSNLWLNPDVKEDIENHSIPLYSLRERTIDTIIAEEGIELVYLSVYDETPELLNLIDTSKCHVILTIHDLRRLEMPYDFYQILYKPWSKGARFLVKSVLSGYLTERNRKKVEKVLEKDGVDIVTVSEHSSFAFKSYFPQYRQLNIPVFYSPSTSHVTTNTRKYEDKYFLLVSCNRFNKNNLRAIKALDRLFTYGYCEEFQVRLTGISSLDAFWTKIRNRNRFKCLGFVDDRELDQLFHDAYCFIFPTLNEGFGYPPLEAMKYGIPVLASPFSAVSEVCGGSVIYFNPFSIEEIMNRILMIIDRAHFEKYSELGKERYDLITKRQREDLDGLIRYIYK